MRDVVKHRQMKGIAGIGEQRERTLAEIGIKTAAELAAAVPATVHEQLVGSGHRVRVDEVAKWVEAAKRTVEASWQRAATFVVSFESMPDTTPDDRRTVVERTEVEEDPAPAMTWTGWNCSELCAWMRAQLGSEPESDEQPGREQPDQTEPVKGAPPPVSESALATRAESLAPDSSGRPTRRHQLVRAAIVDRFGQERPLVADGSAVVGAMPIVLPAQLTLTTPSPQGVVPLIWVRLRPLVGHRAAAILGPASPRSTNGDEILIDLPGEMTPGDYEVTIVVADADGEVAPIAVALTRAVVPSG